MNTSSNIPNHMVWTVVSTIVATVTCCPLGLLGIVGIVFSSKVNNLLAAGDIPGAQRASASAKTWAIVASVLAVIGILLSIFAFMSGGMAAYTDYLNAASSR